MHDRLGHTQDELEKFGVIGPIDERMNKIRAELGKSWGQRVSYTYINFQGINYYPMSNEALKTMRSALPKLMLGVKADVKMPEAGVIKQKSSIIGKALGHE